MSKNLEVEYRALDSLIPYARNSRTHSPEQIAQIAGSIREFGFTNPILIDERDTIIAGHGRLAAAQKLGLEEVPCIVLADLTEAKRKALVIADNRIALNAGWDFEMLAVELDELNDLGFDLNQLGFSKEELNDLIGTPNTGPEPGDGEGDLYTTKIETPVYAPKGEKPAIEALFENTKTLELMAEINKADVSDDEKAFLIRAANRHIVFDYHQIAEYYCHATPEMQRLMEASALVIIDFEKAIESGYAKLSGQMGDIYSASHGDGGNDEE